MTLTERMVRVETELKDIKQDTTQILQIIREITTMKENIKSNIKDIDTINLDIKDYKKETCSKFRRLNSEKIKEMWGIIVLFCGVVANYIITFTNQ